MGLFSNQLSNVVEWDETKEGVIFWKWPNDEIKKGSKLVIRPGQDAIFMYNGVIEGIFKEEGRLLTIFTTPLPIAPYPHKARLYPFLFIS